MGGRLICGIRVDLWPASFCFDTDRFLPILMQTKRENTKILHTFPFSTGSRLL
jgi:hypothetical protein